MLDLVIVDERLEVLSHVTFGEIERHSAHAVVIASGGYGNVFFLSTNAMGSNATAA
jgi:succinate dehydrogenase / fumarate reductase flavoprotein subunit